MDATNMQRLPGEVLDILKEPIEGLRRAPQGSAAGSEPQAASVYSPGEVSPPNQDPEASTHNEGLRMIRGPVALRAVSATPHMSGHWEGPAVCVVYRPVELQGCCFHNVCVRLTDWPLSLANTFMAELKA